MAGEAGHIFFLMYLKTVNFKLCDLRNCQTGKIVVDGQRYSGPYQRDIATSFLHLAMLRVIDNGIALQGFELVNK